ARLVARLGRRAARLRRPRRRDPRPRGRDARRPGPRAARPRARGRVALAVLARAPAPRARPRGSRRAAGPPGPRPRADARRGGRRERLEVGSWPLDDAVALLEALAGSAGPNVASVAIHRLAGGGEQARRALLAVLGRTRDHGRRSDLFEALAQIGRAEDAAAIL